jgi:hypothetical protein
MRSRISTLCCLLICASSTIQGQQKREDSRPPRYVAVPSESILLVVASQPNCLLKIEDARLLVSVDGKNPPLYEYRLRNRGAKSISSYTIAARTSYDTGWSMERELKEILMPGQAFSPDGKDYPAEIVPLTDELRSKLNLRKPMKAIIVLMIEDVKFTDGSTYSDEQASLALQDYFQDINTEVINSKASQ